MISFDDMLNFNADKAAMRATGLSIQDDGTRSLSALLSQENAAALRGELFVREDTYPGMPMDGALSVLSDSDFRLRYIDAHDSEVTMAFWRHGILAALTSHCGSMESLTLYLNVKVREGRTSIYMQEGSLDDEGFWCGSILANAGLKHILGSLDSVCEPSPSWSRPPETIPGILERFVRDEIVR